MSINRRRLLSSALAVPAGASIVFSRSQSPVPGAGDDATLFAAERRVTELLAQKGTLQAAAESAGSYTAEFEDTVIEPLTDEQFALEGVIAQTPAATLLGATVKLRWLAKEILVTIGDEDDIASVCCRQVLALIERELGQAAAA
jgi:hypothetical protein